MQTTLVNIIGAGAVGKTIGKLLVLKNLVRIGAVCNQSLKSANEAVAYITQGLPTTFCELPKADIIFITTQDSYIKEIAIKLAQTNALKKNSIIVHCSGALSSDILSPLKARGCYIASIHPMMSFVDPELSISQFAGTYCAIEGDDIAITVITKLFKSLDAIVYKINKTKKDIYHCAGVFASNYLITLAEQSVSCMQESGVDNKTAMRAVINIMRMTVDNLENSHKVKEALTGPIKRGDINVVQQHIDCMSDDMQRSLYKLLGTATLKLISEQTDNHKRIMEILSVVL